MKSITLLAEELYKIALSSNDDKIIPSIHSIETYAYGTSKDLVYKAEKIKCNNIVKLYKKFYLWLYYRRKHKEKIQIPDHPYREIIVGISRSGSANSLLNLIIYQPDIDKNFFIY